MTNSNSTKKRTTPSPALHLPMSAVAGEAVEPPTAPAAGRVPQIHAAQNMEAQFGEALDQKDESITRLPFVRDTSAAERLAGAPPRIFWSVRPTGSHTKDCATGARYAALALNYMAAENFSFLLRWILLEMIEAGPTHSGIEVEFFAAIERNIMTTRPLGPGRVKIEA